MTPPVRKTTAVHTPPSEGGCRFQWATWSTVTGGLLHICALPIFHQEDHTCSCRRAEPAT